MTGVMHASLAPVLAGGDVRPNLILAAVVTVTLLLGLGAGAVWAFVGGLTANVLTTDPLGSIPLGLLLAVPMVIGLSRAVGQSGLILALTAGAAGSILVDLLGLILLALGTGSVPSLQVGSLAALILPTAVVNGLLTAALWSAARAALSRFGFEAATV